MSSSHKQILKTTGLIASVQVIQIIFNIIRNKALAIIVGPAGFGIWSLYKSFIQMATEFSVLGMHKSAVKEIAQNSDNQPNRDQVIDVFRLSIIVLSFGIFIISIVYCKSISYYIFESKDHYFGIMVTGLTVFLTNLSNANIATLNGLRELKGLAISQIIGAIIGSLAAILLVLLLGKQGIPLFILMVAIVTAVSTSYFVKRLKLKYSVPTKHSIKKHLPALLKVGMGFCISAIIASSMTFMSRKFLISFFDLKAVGIYQSCWSISNMYIGMILGAMGVDLMPRLAKVIHDDKKTSIALNEQVEFSILLGSFGIIILLIFSPLVLNFFYSSEFNEGITIIKWQLLGVGLRLLAFPFSYVIMTKEKSFQYIAAQATFWVLDYLLVIVISKYLGFKYLGINFLIAYLLYYSVTFIFARKLINFKYSKRAIILIVLCFTMIIIAFFISKLSYPSNYIIGSILILSNSYVLFFVLKRYLQIDISSILRKLTGKQ
ncbi:oligosaccharide flippase family protein [uncultured Draconibacterium sp.]|uniref:oligosaccharide flippase family protein n=1 Tax=uncultured Draconibacterium sp. TaxID=1573823 RepID=UPI0029C74A85|nr:oligosaccharide flippase family protein [uncultured Draconibacterium sp.]